MATIGGDLGQEAGGGVAGWSRTDAFEPGPRCGQFEDGGGVVTERMQRATRQHPRFSDFVRGSDLLPPFLRLTELGKRPDRISLRQPDLAMDARDE